MRQVSVAASNSMSVSQHDARLSPHIYGIVMVCMQMILFCIIPLLEQLGDVLFMYY